MKRLNDSNSPWLPIKDGAYAHSRKLSTLSPAGATRCGGNRKTAQSAVNVAGFALNTGKTIGRGDVGKVAWKRAGEVQLLRGQPMSAVRSKKKTQATRGKTTVSTKFQKKKNCGHNRRFGTRRRGHGACAFGLRKAKQATSRQGW